MPQASYRFGDFDLDVAQFELRHAGNRLKLERIPLELLILLAERSGHLVSRAEIGERLWGKDVFVDTEHGINTAVRKIRAALGEDPDQPRFLFTIPGKGYRLVVDPPAAPVTAPAPTGSRTQSDAAVIKPVETESPPSLGAPRRRVRLAVLAAAMVVTIALVAIAVEWARGRAWVATPPIHSIAVLPLANLTGDASQEYLADGITDELTTMLAKRTPLRVISRTTAMQFKGSRRPLPEIARQLGSDAIVEGSIAKTGNEVHVAIQLIHAASDTHLWADSFDRDRESLYALPADLSVAIAHKLGVSAAPAAPPRRIRPEAHDAYLHGRYFWFAEGYVRALEYMQHAVELQPDYAAAWSGLADAFAVRAIAQQVTPGTVMPQAEAASRRSLALDEQLPEAHNAAAALALFDAWDFNRAEEESRRAIELNPAFAEAYHLRAYVLMARGERDAALRAQTRSSELDPFARPFALGYILVHLRQYDAGIRELRVRKDMQPHDASVRFNLADACLYAGRIPEFVEELAALLETRDGNAVRALETRRAFERGGLHAVAELRLKEVERAAGDEYVSPLTLAHSYARAGHRSDTLRQLEAALAERSPRLVFLETEPDFDFLHDDPRYRAIISKIGLAVQH